jgi:uridine kinase
MTEANKQSRTRIIGIAGASGSGKTFFAQKLLSSLSTSAAILSQDFYYRDQNHLSLEQRAEINYDHPDAIDFELMQEHLRQLKSGQPITHPLYDFTTHSRQKGSQTIAPAPIVLVDGILIYVVEGMRKLFDYKVYIDTPADVCFIRRLQRDVESRGRSVESVISQYLDSVRPMFLKYVQPSSQYADFITAGIGDMDEAVEHIKDVCSQFNGFH